MNKVIKMLSNIDTFNVISWALMLIALAMLVVLLIKIFPLLLKMAPASPCTIRSVIQFIINEKTLKCINWIHAKISEKLKKWWLKIQ